MMFTILIGPDGSDEHEPFATAAVPPDEPEPVVEVEPAVLQAATESRAADPASRNRRLRLRRRCVVDVMDVLSWFR
jgi:hypothetical protein